MVKILDNAGQDLPTGQMGDIVIDTAGNMKEIWRSPEATAERWTSDGFLRTGDIGYLDEDGFLFVAGRATEIIATVSGLVSPAAVEDALMAHPAVREVAAYGLPEGTGEVIHVTLCLEAGALIDVAELARWCAKNVDPRLRPAGITISEQPLARNPVGKLLRAEIKKAYCDQA